MNYLNLPSTTIVERFIAKSMFDQFTNTRQKNQFTKHINKIRWTNKISKETTNLQSIEIEEIQIFEIELKEKKEIPKLLEVIEKAIPYHIIFVVCYQDEAYISTTKKHPNPLDENKPVIDWTFTSNWYKLSKSKYELELRKSIDFTYKKFCLQLSGNALNEEIPMSELIDRQQNIKSLQHQIEILKSKISKEKQFNKRVEQNLKLKELQKELNHYLKA